MPSISYKKSAQAAIRDWLGNGRWHNPFAVTLNLKQATKIETDRGPSYVRLNEHYAAKNLRFFINKVTKHYHGNAGRRFGKRLPIVPVLEGGNGHRLHYHLMIDLPETAHIEEVYPLFALTWKIDETDQLVWDTVLEVLTHSNLFKEEVKKQVMGESITHKDQSDEIKKLRRKLKVVEKDISDVTSSIVNLEMDKILKRRDRHELDRILKNVEDARIDLEAQQEQLKVQLHGLENQTRWTDWLSKFGDRLGAMAEFVPQERHEFLKGVIDHIVVKTLDKQSHELVIRFKIPYVNDRLVWRDPSRKSLGYDLADGDFSIDVGIDTKKKMP